MRPNELWLDPYSPAPAGLDPIVKKAGEAPDPSERPVEYDEIRKIVREELAKVLRP